MCCNADRGFLMQMTMCVNTNELYDQIESCSLPSPSSGNSCHVWTFAPCIQTRGFWWCSLMPKYSTWWAIQSRTMPTKTQCFGSTHVRPLSHAIKTVSTISEQGSCSESPMCATCLKSSRNSWSDSLEVICIHECSKNSCTKNVFLIFFPIYVVS